MSTYTLVLLTLCFTCVLSSTYRAKFEGTLMGYMVFVMSFSMSIGLSIGFYLGMYFNGNLLISTLLAMLVGGIVGLLVGLRFHLFSALEGLFSGMMAGIMEAMITEMLDTYQAHTILLISLLLTLAIAMSCILQFLSETYHPFINRRFLFLLSGGILLIVVVFLTFPDTHEGQDTQQEPHMENHSEH